MSDVLTVQDIQDAVKVLQANNVPPGPDGEYLVYFHPSNLRRPKRAMRRKPRTRRERRSEAGRLWEQWASWQCVVAAATEHGMRVAK